MSYKTTFYSKNKEQIYNMVIAHNRPLFEESMEQLLPLYKNILKTESLIMI